MDAKTIDNQFAGGHTGISSDAGSSVARGWRIVEFLTLTKPRIMALAVFTALVGLSRAPDRLDPLTALAAVVAIAAGAAAAGTLNMWHDADIDAVMTRTAMRPNPGCRVSRFEALVVCLFLGIFAGTVLALATSLVAASWCAAAIVFSV